MLSLAKIVARIGSTVVRKHLEDCFPHWVGLGGSLPLELKPAAPKRNLPGTH